MIKKILSTALYVLGIAAMVFLGIKAWRGGSELVSPDALVPVTSMEANLFALGLLCVPMVFVGCFLISAYKIKKIAWKILILLPAVAAMVPFVYSLYVIFVTDGYAYNDSGLDFFKNLFKK